MKVYQFLVVFIMMFSVISEAQQSLHSDFFEIKIINKSEKIYDNHGTDGHSTVSIWRPIPEDGYIVFGDMLAHPQNPTGNKKPITIAVKPKPGFENLLRWPTSYEWVWSNAGSGGSKLVNVNRLICPTGYVALGMMAWTDKDKTTDCKCIKETVYHKGETFRLVSKANYATEKEKSKVPFYQNHGTDANMVVSLWKTIIKSKPGKGVVSIPPNTFFANEKSQSDIPGDTPYALNLKFDSDLDEKLPVNDNKIVLTSNNPPSPANLKNMGETKTYYVPFFAVVDKEYSSQLEQFLNSPTYKIVRTSYFEFLEGMTTDSNAGAIGDQVFGVKTGLEKGTQHQTALGVTAGISVTTSMEVSAGVEGIGSAKAGVATTASLETSFSYSWGGSTTASKDESREQTFKVPPGCYSAIFQRTSEYQIYRKDGSPVGNSFTVGQYDFVQKIFKQ